MVIITSYKSLDDLCFSDFPVLGIEIDEKEKVIRVDLEGVCLIKNKKTKRLLGKGYLKINHFREIKAKFSNCVKQTEGKANIEQVRQLKEINDHEVGNNYLKIFGFIDDGSWVECEIIGGDVRAEFVE